MKPSARDENGQSELAFFGKITAGVSHEIKNNLAVIKEEAGLISDLIAMAERGRPLNAPRVKELSEKILRRVDMIDEIVKRLNRFAHSVDEPVRTFDLSELAALLAALCQRFAAMKKVKLEVSPAPGQVQITNDPFLLMRALHLVLERALAQAGEGGTVLVAVRDQGDTASFAFSGSFIGPLLAAPPSDLLEAMVQSLGALMTEEKDPARVTFSLPKDLHKSKT